jgi:hypothetical protein
MTSVGPPADLDLSEIAEIAAHDAAHRIFKVRQLFLQALDNIKVLEATGCNREIALGGGIEMASRAGRDTAYREAIFHTCCAYFDLTCEEANDCVERYATAKSGLSV